MTALDIAEVIPGGILPSDHLHVGDNDGTCSRCRKPPPEDDVPLLLWPRDGEDLYIFCRRCLDPPPDGAPVCRICGCWDLDACWDEEAGPCWWVEPDLCSHCDKRTDAEGQVVALESPRRGQSDSA